MPRPTPDPHADGRRQAHAQEGRGPGQRFGLPPRLGWGFRVPSPGPGAHGRRSLDHACDCSPLTRCVARRSPSSGTAGAAASDGARWTGYTGLIIASGPDGVQTVRGELARPRCGGRSWRQTRVLVQLPRRRPRSLAQPGVEEGVQATPRAAAPIGMMALTWCTKRGNRTKAGEDGRPGPQDDHAAPGPVAEAEQPVVDVLLVGRVEARPPGRAADEGEGHVHEWARPE